MDALELLTTVALDLTSALSAEDRYRRLLEVVRRVLPCDAAALLRLDGDALLPVATHGLAADTLGRRFRLAEHPRLERICGSREPVLFPPGCELPDPYDGLVAGDATSLEPIHACLGCALHVEGVLIGALTADALTPGAFDGIDTRLLAALGALAGAAMRTSRLIEALEATAARQGRIARDLMREAQLGQGGQLLGAGEAMERLRRDIALVGPSDYTVLVTGETGVGKELVARAIHAASKRRDEPLLHVNCAALPETLAESELFGHAKGAFTGATSDRAGKFEVADGATLFLDEVGELPLSIQPKLLRALQSGEIQRVGTDRPLRVDVRVIAATNRDLAAEVAAGKFRPDLFHRLNVYPIGVPPLRERREDVAVLAGFFCDLGRARLGLGPVRLSPEALGALRGYDWPGNVRELENVLSRAVLKAAAGATRGGPVVVAAGHLGPEFSGGPAPGQGASTAAEAVPRGATLREAVDAFQRELIRRALAESGGRWAAAARALGMHRSNLHHLAERLGLRAEGKA